MARQIDFVDGASSETAPTIGNIVASALVQYPDDATYEATEQGAPAAGNLYYNTTIGEIRFYDHLNAEWVTLSPYEVDDSLFHIIGSDDDTKKIRFEVDGNTTGITRVITSVDEDGVMVLEAATQTLTNKTIEVVNNTVVTQASGNLTSTDLNAALDELQTDIDTREVAANKGVANGYASLDGMGKLPSSELPVSAMEYAGAWDANTNSPALIDGTGDNGDMYRISVSGSQDLGSGSISFAPGDAVIYNGTIWEKIPADNPIGDTDDLPEGSTNLYYTDVRADARITAAVIDDLSDVDTTTVAPTDSQVLTWNNANSEWAPQNSSAGAIDDLTDVDTTTAAPVAGDALRFDGTDWVTYDPDEVIESVAQVFTPGSNGNWVDGTSITLPPGTWDIQGWCQFSFTGAGTSDAIELGISSTSGNSNAGMTFGDDIASTHYDFTGRAALIVPTKRVTTAVATTYYLKNLYYSANTNLTAVGSLRARRIK